MNCQPVVPSGLTTAFCTEPLAKTRTGFCITVPVLGSTPVGSQISSLSINGSPSRSTIRSLASLGTLATLIVLRLPVTGSRILTGSAALENSLVMALSCALLTSASSTLSALSIFLRALFTAVCACFFSLTLKVTPSSFVTASLCWATSNSCTPSSRDNLAFCLIASDAP